MTHSEKCRKRMEDALATTEEGRKRLTAAEDRMHTRLAEEVEESRDRPERGMEAVGPDVEFQENMRALHQ